MKNALHSETYQIFHEIPENKSVSHLLTQLVTVLDTRVATWSVAIQITATFFET